MSAFFRILDKLIQIVLLSQSAGGTKLGELLTTCSGENPLEYHSQHPFLEARIKGKSTYVLLTEHLRAGDVASHC